MGRSLSNHELQHCYGANGDGPRNIDCQGNSSHHGIQQDGLGSAMLSVPLDPMIGTYADVCSGLRVDVRHGRCLANALDSAKAFTELRCPEASLAQRPRNRPGLALTAV